MFIRQKHLLFKPLAFKATVTPLSSVTTDADLKSSGVMALLCSGGSPCSATANRKL